ncbi:MAG: hypothetical protein IBX47_11155 [Desulfuromonadales bacterium]|nr:hypothetical protein [Desulfuromonadales bacterium]
MSKQERPFASVFQAVLNNQRFETAFLKNGTELSLSLAFFECVSANALPIGCEGRFEMETTWSFFSCAEEFAVLIIEIFERVEMITTTDCRTPGASPWGEMEP